MIGGQARRECPYQGSLTHTAAPGVRGGGPKQADLQIVTAAEAALVRFTTFAAGLPSA